MKVILLKDVNKVGKKDQIVEVSIGYANNYLFAKKLAVAYSDKSIEILKQQEQDRIDKDNQNRENAKKLKEELKNITLEFKAKTGKDGKMFGTISLKQVQEQLKEKYNIEIDKRKFINKTPIDSLGVVILQNELYKGVIADIRVHVLEE